MKDEIQISLRYFDFFKVKNCFTLRTNVYLYKKTHTQEPGTFAVKI